MDWTLAAAALGIGIVVGLTGMGGGALMTPVLVLFFNISAPAAVSSDLVAAAVMKPVGSFVHLRAGTVSLGLVKWLCIGSVPTAFCGALIGHSLGNSADVQNAIKLALGIALALAATGLFARAYLRLAERARNRDGSRDADPDGVPDVVVKPVPTVIIGAVGGLVVGLTSVGSGSLIIIALMMLYPTLRANQLVGTDIVQAVPLVISAAVGHLIFGDVQFGITGALLVGSIPGAFIGAQLSSRLPGALIRRALAFVLLASSLKLLNVSTTLTLVVLAAMVAVAGPIWMLLRRAHGFPALPRNERAVAAAADDAVGKPEVVVAGEQPDKA
jgi:uncharacterized membrane protein YfcA